MHHMLFPVADAFISNKSNEKDLNFGLDEMLILGVSHSYAKVLNTTKTYHFGHEYVAGMNFQNFTGTFTGSFFGTVYNTSGSIVGGATRFTSSHFDGDVSGSVMGTIGGFPFQSSNYSGSLTNFSGNIESYTINGLLTGSLIANCFSLYTGWFYTAIGNATGYVTGNEVKQEENITTTLRSYINRSLIKFDLNFISQSIVNGDITNPRFHLKIKSTQARELPLTYKIYAFPVNKSWNQGVGYFSDGGSTEGASWNWRDFTGGTPWYPYTTDILTASVDYLGDYGSAEQSWLRGGGTWDNIPCTQSFDYEVSDINMDVTPIVNAWINNQEVNNGFILMYGGEIDMTASNAHLFFFSKETNTIYSPRLDVAWDDSQYVTGSFGTGSVTITYFDQGFSGSMLVTSQITGITASGNFNGSAYLNMNPLTGEVFGDSVMNVVGNSGNVLGLRIDGFFTGSASNLDVSGSRVISGSMKSGDFQNSTVYFSYKNSEVAGYLSGSFTGQLFSGHGIQGELPNAHEFTVRAFQNSPARGNVLGFQAVSTPNFAEIKGIATDGVLQGANVDILFTGSNCYVSESFSITSSVQITASLLPALDVDKPFVVILQDLKKEYNSGDVPRIGVFAREHFPLKTFAKAPQQPAYVTPKYLPTSSYYAIKDNETEEIIVDFDNYTKISCDQSGNYFYLDTTGLSQERYYKVLIKVVGPDEVYTFDANDLFKVRR